MNRRIRRLQAILEARKARFDQVSFLEKWKKAHERGMVLLLTGEEITYETWLDCHPEIRDLPKIPNLDEMNSQKDNPTNESKR